MWAIILGDNSRVCPMSDYMNVLRAGCGIVSNRMAADLSAMFYVCIQFGGQTFFP
jgi:hypothetical protein